MRRRVVVTGMGTITSLGHDVESLWQAVLRGESGAGPITYFDASNYATQIAAEVKGFDPTRYVDRKEARRMDPFVQFAVAAALTALRDAGLEITDANRTRVGVCVGSGIGGVETWDQEHRILQEKGPHRVSPFFIPMLIGNMAAGHIAILTGAQGPNKALVTACATGAHAIGDALRLIQYGEAEVMIAGGTESAIRPLPIAGFCSMKALSRRNEAPQRASRPFDRDRDGFLMAEGSGILILEELNHARRRDARIYAEIIGYGTSGDAYHMAEPLPCGTGAVLSMQAALRDAGLAPEEVCYINAHAPSTSKGDLSETIAIKRVFGDHARKLMVSSTKSMTGHLLGAAGGVETILSVLTVQRGVAPPTINYETPDPECDLDYVPNEAREADLPVALSNSFGFGGQNASLIVRRFTG
jgi:3-oxoacyl-[acyl-carrier-protein] synthase II